MLWSHSRDWTKRHVVSLQRNISHFHAIYFRVCSSISGETEIPLRGSQKRTWEQILFLSPPFRCLRASRKVFLPPPLPTYTHRNLRTRGKGIPRDKNTFQSNIQFKPVHILLVPKNFLTLKGKYICVSNVSGGDTPASRYLPSFLPSSPFPRAHTGSAGS